MTEQPRSTDDLASAKKCLAVYGADLARWPADARTRWGALAVGDMLQEELRDAETLDEMLNAATAPRTPHSLKSRITARYHPLTDDIRRGSVLWPDLSVLSNWLKPLPAGAFASMAAAGFLIAWATESGARLAPEYEAYAYLEEGGFGALDDETGALWDVE